MRKFVLFAATVAVVLATFGAYSVASADDRGNAQVIRLRADVVSEAEIDNGEEGFGLGDALVFGEDLYDRSSGAPVGKLGASCVVVRFDEDPFALDVGCNGNFVLAQGQVSVQGLVTFSEDSGPRFTVSVIGGTGAYRNAHGEVQVEEVDETTTNYTIRLT